MLAHWMTDHQAIELPVSGEVSLASLAGKGKTYCVLRNPTPGSHLHLLVEISSGQNVAVPNLGDYMVRWGSLQYQRLRCRISTDEITVNAYADQFSIGCIGGALLLPRRTDALRCEICL